jgi:multiple sugar transport system substrate-binding protein
VLQFWNPASDTLGAKIIADLCTQFNKQENDFQVKDIITDDSNHYTKYVTAIASGQPPDAIMTYDYSPIVTWSSQGLIIPLDAYAAQAGVQQSDYFPVCWEMINFNGHLWGFLQEFDFDILAWNKDLFSKAGLDPNTPPKTMDEMTAFSQKLISKKPDGSLGEIPFAPWVTGNPREWAAIWGGGYYDVAKGEFTIATEPNINSVQWHVDFSDMLGGPDKVTSFTKLFTGNQTPFYAGQMAMEAIGEYNPVTFPQLAPQLNYAVGYFPTAAGVPYGTGSTDGGNVFVIPKGAQHEQQSVNFIKWMSGPGPVLQWNVQENNVPPVKAVALSDSFAKQVPLMAKWIDELKLNLLIPPVISPVVDYFNDQLTTAIQEAIYHRMTPKAALTQLDQKVKQQLQEYNKSH